MCWILLCNIDFKFNIWYFHLNYFVCVLMCLRYVSLYYRCLNQICARKLALSQERNTHLSRYEVVLYFIFHCTLKSYKECIIAEMPIFQTAIILQTNNLIRVPFALTGNFLLKSACIGPWASAVTWVHVKNISYKNSASIFKDICFEVKTRKKCKQKSIDSSNISTLY